MEMRPRGPKADRPQALDESVESRWRATLSRSEFVRRDEEPRHVGFRFEEGEEPRRRDRSPRERLKAAHNRGISERTEPQRPDRTASRSGCGDSRAGAGPEHMP